MNNTLNLQEIIGEVVEQLRGMWRYRWWAAGAAWIISLAGWFFVYSMPDVYKATAKVYLETETLMDSVFEGLAIRDNLEAQVNAVSRALLTRPNLESVARATDYDLRADTQAQMERLITDLQRNIKVSGDSRRNIFEVSFEDANRSMARDVVAAIVDAFVEDSLQGQGSDAEMTEKALEAEIENHQRRLEEAESRLAEFKKDNLGFMPDDRGDYYARLQAAIQSVEDTEAEMSAVAERRQALERQVAGESPVLGGEASGIISSCSKGAQISQLQGQLAALQVDFTDKHPRIVTLKETIDVLTEQCEQEWQATLESGRSPASGGGDELEANPVYQDLRIRLTDAELELASLRSKLAQQRGEVSKLRSNMDRIVDVEKNLNQLNRDYDVVFKRYQELLSRRETLRSKQRLGPAGDSVPFRTLEPPFASGEPTGPNRPLFLAGVFVVALAFGGVLAFGLNQLNPVFFTRRSVRRVAGLPVLGSVSMLLSPVEARARRRGAIAWAGSYVVLLMATGFVISFQSQGASLLRQILGDFGA